MSHSAYTINRIRQYYLGEEVILNEDEANILKRWEEAFTFLRDTKSIPETVALLRRRFPEISKRTLFKDANSSLQLFGDVIKYSKEAMRNMANDYALDYLNRCKTLNDRNNEKSAIAMLIKINRLDKDEVEEMDPASMILEAPRIEIPEHVSSMIYALIGNGAVNLMQLREKATLNLNERAPEVQPAAAVASDSASA